MGVACVIVKIPESAVFEPKSPWDEMSAVAHIIKLPHIFVYKKHPVGSIVAIVEGVIEFMVLPAVTIE